MTRKQKIILAVVIAIVGLGAAGLAIAANSEKGTAVRTEVVVRRDLVAVVTASGHIQPKRKVDISADIAGRVIRLAVEEGQWVNRGDLLLRIDPTTYQAAVRRAEAAVAQARAQAAQARANALQTESALSRSEQIAQSNELISSADLEQARTQAAVAQAQYEAARFGIAQAEAQRSEAREALRKTTIVAPMGGRVTRLNIEEGETAVVGTMNNPGSLLLTIADLSEMEARVKVDETDVPRLSFGDSATVRIDAFPNQTFTGRVTRIANSAIQAAGNQTGGTTQTQAVDFEVVITLANPPEELRPDLSATAEIVTDTRQNVLAIPILALTVRDPEGKRFRSEEAETAPGATATAARHPAAAEVEGVFVVREGKAVFVPVEVGIASDRYFEVRGGLDGGEIVVSGSYQAVRELEQDQVVRIQNAPPGAAPAARGGSPAQEPG